MGVLERYVSTGFDRLLMGLVGRISISLSQVLRGYWYFNSDVLWAEINERVSGVMPKTLLLVWRE